MLFDNLSADDSNGQSWLRALKHSLHWLRTHDPEHALADGELTDDKIFAWLAQTTSADASRLRTTVKRYCEQEHMLWMVRNKHQHIVQICQTAGVHVDVSDTASAALEDEHPCTICTKKFNTPQGLSTHLWKAHGKMSLERSYVFGPVCRICNRCYWSSQRMQQHLRYSRRHNGGCLQLLVQHFEPLTEPIEVRAPETFVALHRLPWVQADGPAAPLPQPPHIQRRMEAWRKWHLQWQRFDMPEDLSSEDAGAYHDQFTSATHEWISLDDPED